MRMLRNTMLAVFMTGLAGSAITGCAPAGKNAAQAPTTPEASPAAPDNSVEDEASGEPAEGGVDSQSAPGDGMDPCGDPCNPPP